MRGVSFLLRVVLRKTNARVPDLNMEPLLDLGCMRIAAWLKNRALELVGGGTNKQA